MQNPLEILQEYWGHSAFRPLQADIVDSILSGNDTLALLPTGGGKSVCFQVPGMALPGLTLVISPLIALMRDQVEQLNSRHIPATYVNSSLSFREIDRKLQMAIDGRYKFLYLAPERIESEMFLARLKSMNISLVAVDEAHCISQWGYDFRPSYLRIAVLRKHLPGVPFAAFTATAPPKVREDILEKLEMRRPKVFTQSFRRSNLSYNVVETENVADKILEYVRTHPGAGIVYARTRKRVQAIAEMLQKTGIKSAAYHGGMKNEDRNRVQSGWIQNELRVIAATNAFGMGIDKPDVRFVLHFNMPADLESYYQEAGRAGRDGKPCEALSYANVQDITELSEWVAEKYPSWEMLQAHFDILCDHFGITVEEPPGHAFNLDSAAVARKANVNPLRFHNSIRLLDQTGVVSLNERPEDFGRIMLCVSPENILEYKKRYPEKAFLIDHMLRTLGGEVYSDAVSFLPANWAKRLNMELPVLEQHLIQLALRGIISYQPPTTMPTIRFLFARQKLHKEVLGWDKVLFLQEQARIRLEEVKKYLQVPSKGCRSSQLEAYFGEKPDKPCGVCDWCKSQVAKMPWSKLRLLIRQEVLQMATENAPIAIRTLMDAGQGDPKERVEVIREMIDSGELLRVDSLHVRRK